LVHIIPSLLRIFCPQIFRFQMARLHFQNFSRITPPRYLFIPWLGRVTFFLVFLKFYRPSISPFYLPPAGHLYRFGVLFHFLRFWYFCIRQIRIPPPFLSPPLSDSAPYRSFCRVVPINLPLHFNNVFYLIELPHYFFLFPPCI